MDNVAVAAFVNANVGALLALGNETWTAIANRESARAAFTPALTG